MRSVVCALLVVVTIGGCAEQVETVDDVAQDDPDVDATPETFMVSLAAGDAIAGQNITLELGIDGPEALNVTLVEWSLRAAGLDLAGTGLPATVDIMLEAGNHTLLLEASADGFLPANATLELAVLEVLDDPCAGIGVQEPVSLSGSNLLVGDTTTHEFELLPCQGLLAATITMGGGSVDNDWFLYDPAGTEQGSGTTFGIREEVPITVSDPGKLVAGTWKIMVENWAGAAASYEITISFE